MSYLKNILAAAALSTASFGEAHAGEDFQREVLSQENPRVKAACDDMRQRVDKTLILEQNICEYSVDEGITWQTYGLGGITLAGLLALGVVIFLRFRKPDEGTYSRFLTARKVSSYFGDQAVRDNERNDGTSENYTHTKGDEDANLNNPIILTDGLYTDEERILQDGIEKTPSRYELREELLKIYAKRKDREKFKALFLRTMEKCPLEAPSKKRVLALIGRMIDPENPLYHSILNGETDPGAVADLYLASGRHIEAETVLIKAIGEDPRTYNIYVKLLKIYAERGDTKNFEAFYRTTKEGFPLLSSEEIEKLKTLGQKIDPENSLYRDDSGLSRE